MGLPMSGSLLYSLMSDISAAQINLTQRKGQSWFYHKHVWNIFSNEVFKKIADEQTLQKVADIKKEARHYISQEDFSGSDLLAAIFKPAVSDPKSASADQISGFAQYQKDVLKVLAAGIADDVTLAGVCPRILPQRKCAPGDWA